jgi:hypothetical protein
MKMAAKRMAGQELNHENWDNEDESEEAGQFKQVLLVVNSLILILMRIQFKSCLCQNYTSLPKIIEL